MSDIQVTTEFLVKTDQAEARIVGYTARLLAEAAKWRNITVDVGVRFRAPDVTAIQRVVRALQAKPIEIPVRLVPQGAMGKPSVNRGGGGFTNARATSGGGSVALTNGQPGVDPQGFAGSAAAANRQTYTASDARVQDFGAALGGIVDVLKTVPMTIREAVNDFKWELTDLSRTVGKVNANGRRSAYGSEAGPGKADAPSTWSPTGKSPTAYDIAGDTYDLTSTTKDRGSPESRAQKAAEYRNLRNARFRTYINNAGATSANGDGYDGAPDAEPNKSKDGTGGSHGKGLAGFFRTHPAVGQFAGAGGGIYGINLFAESLTAANDAGYGLRGAERGYARNKAFTETFRIPVASNVGDFIGSSINYARGDGFVTNARIAERTVEQSRLQDRVARESLTSGVNAQLSRTFDPRDAIALQRRSDLQSLNGELESADFRDPNTGRLSSIGEARRRGRTGEINARAGRELYDYGLSNYRANGATSLSVLDDTRQAGLLSARASRSFGRNEQIADSTRQIDLRVDQQRNAANGITNPDDRKRAIAELNAAEIKAEAEKDAEKSRINFDYAEKAKALEVDAEQSRLRILNQTFAAERDAIKESWDARIRVEEDGQTKLRMIDARNAALKLKDFERSEQGRNARLNVQRAESQVNGQNYAQQSRDIVRSVMDDPAYSDLTRVYGKGDQTTKAFISPEQMTPQQRDRYNQAQRDIAAQQQAAGIQQSGTALGVKLDTEAARSRVQGNQYATERKRIQDEEAHAREGVDASLVPELKAREESRLAEADRDRGRSLRDINRSASNSRLRAGMRDGQAELQDLESDIARKIEDVRKDPEALSATLSEGTARLKEFAFKGQGGQIFGSAAEYLNTRLEGSLNQDGSRSAALAAAKQLEAASKLDSASVAFGNAIKELQIIK